MTQAERIAEAIDKLKAAIGLLEAYGAKALLTAARLAEQAYELMTDPDAE